MSASAFMCVSVCSLLDILIIFSEIVGVVAWRYIVVAIAVSLRFCRVLCVVLGVFVIFGKDVSKPKNCVTHTHTSPNKDEQQQKQKKKNKKHWKRKAYSLCVHADRRWSHYLYIIWTKKWNETNNTQQQQQNSYWIERDELKERISFNFQYVQIQRDHLGRHACDKTSDRIKIVHSFNSSFAWCFCRCLRSFFSSSYAFHSLFLARLASLSLHVDKQIRPTRQNCPPLSSKNLCGKKNDEWENTIWTTNMHDNK